MTYAQFLLVFLVLPIVAVAALVWRRLRARHAWACGAMCLLAFVYTTPWDNYAAKTGLWSYDPHFAPPSHFLLYLPWEEYAFYFLQCILTCLLVVAFAGLRKPRGGDGL